MRLRNGKIIGDGNAPYIVAEMNSSHNGKIEVAKEMISSAKECGCDAVKFQSWSAESLYSKDYYAKNPIARRMVEKFALSKDELKELADYSMELSIDFSSTPYSKEEIDFLADECNAPFIKIASMDINNLPFLRYAANKGVPLVISTGMASIEEIETAVNEIEKTGLKNLCILHCVSLYPVSSDKVNLNNIRMLKEKFPEYEAGYSDHTLDLTAVGAAVALGASLIERHFTLNNKKNGWDNQMATEPEEMKLLVEHSKKVHASLGSFERILDEFELGQREKMRRSLVAAKDLLKGAKLTETDISAKRPGDGISVAEYEKVLGKTLTKSISKDEMITWENLI